MRTSDYDRQILVQALRELADGNGGELLDRVNRLRVDEVGDYTLFGIGAVLAMDRAGCCDAEDASGYLAALADLIEPQSVEPEAETIYVGPDSREMDVWACPACGEVVSYDFDDYDPKTDGPRYCSGCGRKVAKW